MQLFDFENIMKLKYEILKRFSQEDKLTKVYFYIFYNQVFSD